MDHVDRILAQWRQERPDLDTGPMGIFGRLKRLQQALAEGMALEFEGYGLNAASFDVLATLRRAGPPYALSPSALMEWTMVTSGTMTNRLDRLETAGLIVRRRNPEDGRGQVVALTDRGLALIDHAVASHVANQHRLIAGLSPETRNQLDAGLRAWLALLDARDPGAKG